MFRVIPLLLVCLAVGCAESDRPFHSAQTTAPVASPTTTTAPVTTGTSSPVTFTTRPSPGAAPSRAGRWYAGDLHVHTTHSRDARRQGGDDVATTLRLAEYAGLDFVTISDHNNRHHATDPGFQSSQLILISGEEWGGSSHAGFVGARRDMHVIDRSQHPTTWNQQVRQTFDEVVRDGGVVVVNHPAYFNFWLWDVSGFQAVEVWNAYWSFTHEIPLLPPMVDFVLAREGMTQAGVDVSAELRDAMLAPGGQNDQALAFWEAHLQRGRRVAAVGGGDRHYLSLPGRPTTWVFAIAPTPDAIVDGIRRGRTWIGHRPDGVRVDLTADADHDGVFEAMIGDGVRPAGVLGLRIEVQGADGGRAVVVRDGVRVAVYPIQGPRVVLRHEERTPLNHSWYRVDVFLPVVGSVPWQPGGTLGSLLGTTLAGIQAVALSLGHVVPVPSTLPTIDPPEHLERWLHRDLTDPAWSRAAITSPIYVR